MGIGWTGRNWSYCAVGGSVFPGSNSSIDIIFGDGDDDDDDDDSDLL